MFRTLITTTVAALLLLTAVPSQAQRVVCDCPCAPDDSPLCEPDYFALTPTDEGRINRPELMSMTGVQPNFAINTTAVESCDCGFTCQCDDVSFDVSGFEWGIFKTVLERERDNRMLRKTHNRELKGRPFNRPVIRVVVVLWWIRVEFEVQFRRRMNRLLRDTSDPDLVRASESACNAGQGSAFDYENCVYDFLKHFDGF